MVEIQRFIKWKSINCHHPEHEQTKNNNHPRLAITPYYYCDYSPSNHRPPQSHLCIRSSPPMIFMTVATLLRLDDLHFIGPHIHRVLRPTCTARHQRANVSTPSQTHTFYVICYRPPPPTASQSNLVYCRPCWPFASYAHLWFASARHYHPTTSHFIPEPHDLLLRQQRLYMTTDGVQNMNWG